MKTIKITLDLTDFEVQELREALRSSDAILQLKVVNAILDSSYKEDEFDKLFKNTDPTAL